MLRSLYSGISGLHAHQQMMDVTGNNIANVNTVGYKSEAVQFQDTLSQMVGAAGSPQNGMGGTNPSQVGLGVKVAGISKNFSQGSAETTGKSGDMMIQGDGFFITRTGNEQMYTRAGSFFFDANGTLVTTSGQPVQGWTAVDGKVNAGGQPSDIKMPLGATIPPAATTQITLKGNLTSDFPENKLATEDTVTIPVKVFDKDGATHTVTAKFTRAIDPNRVAGDTPDTTWDIALYGEDGTAISGATGEIDMTSGKAIVSATDTPATGELDKDGNMQIGDYKVNMADLTMYSGLSDARVFSTDGQTAGALTSLAYTVSDTGEIVGVYSNGLKETLGQVAMATFKNPDGLEKVGNSTFRSTVNSGYAQVGQPGSAGMGQVISGALEMSNVDLAQEFTNLVVAQRGFQANSKIITTSDELLQELVSMKR
ncbi:flagellar hook protein [Actinoplanes sp. SE50]|uniref:flagellar hook protein FlgE n=1 Tax=unclassified Actinoplanes TaxID=2626549 RepID=UPI00023EDEFD|nr:MULTISPECIES: flagellar hook protein FlgE [unclassified Actinoplanes]AEV88804.1 Flagellar hook protein FlgE [Actinoplanes sp. SE50/110]ATO87210.1 flagellar hook protein [Actinoplanes sp. SE50]SLM04628.1 flagellar hook protein [Actinoplanes sp. SE50/110]